MTPQDVRDNYGDFEFAEYDNAHMARAIERAANTVARYVIEQPAPGTRAEAALNSVSLTLARAYAHDEQVLSDEHPIVREMREALAWLARIADSKASLPTNPPPPGAPPTPPSAIFSGVAVVAPAAVFSAAALARMPS